MVRLWRPETGECVQPFEGHSDWVRSAFSLDAALVASTSEDQTVRLWPAETGECVQQEELGAVAYRLAFNLDGSRLFASVGAIDIRTPRTPVAVISGTLSHQPMPAYNSTRHIGSGSSTDEC